MRHLRQIPAAARQPGIYNLPEVALGAPSKRFTVAITRDPNTTEQQGVLATVQLEGSDDAGVTWRYLGGITMHGGEARDKLGQLATESALVVELSSMMPAKFRLRGIAAVFQPITAGLRLTVD